MISIFHKKNIHITLFVICGLFFINWTNWVDKEVVVDNGLINQPEKPGKDQDKGLWHGKSRSLRYYPEGHDFVIKNGERRFNRALYGSNTAFRVEAGDLPEFALYLPGMGGNIKLGIIAGDQEKWLIHSDEIIARYRAGSMLYEIKDQLLGNGKLNLWVIPMFDAEGFFITIETVDVPDHIDLITVYGGASGRKFSRDGDIGADPESVFYLHADNCKSNIIQIAKDNSFDLYFGDGVLPGKASESSTLVSNKEKEAPVKEKRRMAGVFPPESHLKTADARSMNSPREAFRSTSSEYPVLLSILNVKTSGKSYFTVYNPDKTNKIDYSELENLISKSEGLRKELAGRIEIKTPDPYINTIGGAMAIAADAIFEHPSYMHGAVAWRMPLNGWRGAYAADWLGWHERAKAHFSSYSLSQYTSPASGPSFPDPATNLAREKEVEGTALFTNGYISRRPGGKNKPHHYDMNMVFVDQLLRHFNWTGDLAYLEEMWPLIERHLDWEKRNFDGDDDGLYSAYASIWASDGLQYNGGGVAHASAYNYYAFKSAARLAAMIGKDPKPYQKEAEKIFKAINKYLWIPEKGWFAEFKDILGNQQLHPYAGLWSVYHLLDSEVPDPFQAYQLTKYVDNEIPHIPIVAEGLNPKEYFTLSTTQWMPYTWSVNNVALAEVLHTSLAYWQAGNAEGAFRLWKSAFMESMYLGASPGNFQQLSFYDAMRGELYRDFADPIGVASRTLIEGLFGIKPDLLNNSVYISPGFPASWEYASLKTPDMYLDYKRQEHIDLYKLQTNLPDVKGFTLQLNARGEKIKKVKINGKDAKWKPVPTAVGKPQIEINGKLEGEAILEVEWSGAYPENIDIKNIFVQDEPINIQLAKAKVKDIHDPQNVLKNISFNKNAFKADILAEKGNVSFFIKLEQSNMTWWHPVSLVIKKPLEVVASKDQPENGLAFQIKNNSPKPLKGKLKINEGSFTMDFSLASGASENLEIKNNKEVKVGSNIVSLITDQGLLETATVINWNVSGASKHFEPLDLAPYFNDKVTNIFKNEYKSPRSPYPTPQIPVHGLGDWCSYAAYMEIDDSGLRSLAGQNGSITIPQGIPFATPSGPEKKNIAFTTIWDNYPTEIEISLSGKASHAYFMMAGTTNPMQSRFENGAIEIIYKDGSTEVLSLRNPETWWPIEQDYFIDGHAFSIDAPKPIRIHLKTGKIGTEHQKYVSIGSFTKYAVDGGAATIMDLPLNSDKELERLRLRTTANDVIIGLMGITLKR